MASFNMVYQIIFQLKEEQQFFLDYLQHLMQNYSMEIKSSLNLALGWFWVGNFFMNYFEGERFVNIHIQYLHMEIRKITLL